MKKSLKYSFLVFLFIALIIYDFYYCQFLKSNFEFFSIYLFPDDKNSKGELFKIILSILGALAVIYGLYVSLRRARAMERGVEKQGESIENQTKQLELSRKSQIDERFKNAIEHLGSEKEPIILGGIAELHQIAKENKKDYAEIVFNILCSYIRSNADIYNKTADDINHTAIQTIINYLFKRDFNQDIYSNLNANLGHTNLLGINFDECNLNKANLVFCYLPSLKKVNLTHANLSGSIFRTSRIFDSDLSNSDLRSVIFHFGVIKDSSMKSCNISSTSFLECEIENVNFDNNTFYQVDFSASYINKISIEECSFTSGKFLCSHLENIDFSKLDLFGGCDFRASSFHSVTINNVITSSNFKGTNNEINKHPQLYDRRLKDRVGKGTEIFIENIEFGNNQIGVLTDEDCDEIKDYIKKEEKRTIEKKKVNSKVDK
ncbi:pentapeptide repeat-containing protein [Confluentibacter sediminis]|uniref:pentapeptide repeat-containing protein n=1 Tax=Confluentibacter sediminis TaxID=2219045 RepID=UPI000DAEDFFD|nr:pentapeptide repeat-containing protein [Confluentibacter sediminis]